MDGTACKILNRRIPQLSEPSRLGTADLDAFTPSCFYLRGGYRTNDNGCELAEDMRAENN